MNWESQNFNPQWVVTKQVLVNPELPISNVWVFLQLLEYMKPFTSPLQQNPSFNWVHTDWLVAARWR